MSEEKYRNIKVLTDTYWKIKELAAKERLSMSKYLHRLVQNDVARRENAEQSDNKSSQ